MATICGIISQIAKGSHLNIILFIPKYLRRTQINHIPKNEKGA